MKEVSLLSTAEKMIYLQVTIADERESVSQNSHLIPFFFKGQEPKLSSSIWPNSWGIILSCRPECLQLFPMVIPFQLKKHHRNCQKHVGFLMCQILRSVLVSMSSETFHCCQIISQPSHLWDNSKKLKSVPRLLKLFQFSTFFHLNIFYMAPRYRM